MTRNTLILCSSPHLSHSTPLNSPSTPNTSSCPGGHQSLPSRVQLKEAQAQEGPAHTHGHAMSGGRAASPASLPALSLDNAQPATFPGACLAVQSPCMAFLHVGPRNGWFPRHLPCTCPPRLPVWFSGSVQLKFSYYQHFYPNYYYFLNHFMWMLKCIEIKLP